MEIPTYKLLSGRTIPLIGLGTYMITGKESVKNVLDMALTIGYRAFDTAAMYENEHEIGLAIKELLPIHNLTRKDVFITTKLLPSDHGERAKGALRQSLKKLDCEYIDLYLIHWPGSYSSSADNSKLRAASWASLVRAKEKGIVKDIGVSNYTVRHLTELLHNCCGVKPVVNQIEWHPGCHQQDLKDLCQKEGILLQAYMPLGGSRNLSLLKDPIVLNIAEKLKKTPSQVLLRWCLQQNVAIIPKASSKLHLTENVDLNFTIPTECMEALNGRSYERFDWDPNSVK